ncbi:MAG: protein-glutamate O-methyltransferase CheR [Tepidanaerobacteraceae bacterium]|nr:protein-glutamate O-methyltransferase CheR [Tepidanaerobacteraceae bacterium]
MAQLDINTRQFQQIRDLINKKSGIFFEEKKVYFLKRRIEERIKQNGLSDMDEYISFLKYGDDGNEFQKLIDEITINETYFFREFEQLKAFAEECLPEILEIKKKRKEKSINVWSAGCSTGEEPYTIAIILNEMLENIVLWDVFILATDINKRVLEIAKKGVYESRSLKQVAGPYISKYFTPVDEEKYKINDASKMLVSFKHGDILESDAMVPDNFYDFIFCRNVLIYFDEVSRKQALEIFHKKLKYNGFIFLGHSESVGRITDSFTCRKMKNYYVYQKL